MQKEQKDLTGKKAGNIDKIKRPKTWSEPIESSNFFRFEKIGDTIEGLLIEKSISSRYDFGLYTIKTFEGEQKRFHGSSQLDDLLINIAAPCYVKITFIDTQQMPSGQTMKLFEVRTGEN